ncbi:MAG: putative membrane protein [Alteromonadaceae bacterium]|jgi:putative membrane protein
MLWHAVFFDNNLVDTLLRRYITFILLIILLTVAFIFGSQNDQSLTLNYLIARTEMSVAQAVSLFTVIGIAIGLLLALLGKLLRAVKSDRTGLSKKVSP